MDGMSIGVVQPAPVGLPQRYPQAVITASCDEAFVVQAVVDRAIGHVTAHTFDNRRWTILSSPLVRPISESFQ